MQERLGFAIFRGKRWALRLLSTTWIIDTPSLGQWKGLTEIPTTSLEQAGKSLQGKDKAEFLEFLRNMLKCRPEERSSARELLADPWLKS